MSNISTQFDMDVLEYNKFRAWIEVDGRKLSCSEIDVDRKTKAVKCCIPSETGKQFAVYFEKCSNRNPCQVTVHLDGSAVGRTWYRGTESATDCFKSVQTSKTIERPFMFSPMQTTDDESFLDVSHTSNSSRDLGKIILEVHRVTNLRVHRKNPRHKQKIPLDEPPEEDFVIPELEKVHEQSVKMSHQISFGEQVDKGPVDEADILWASCDVAELLVTFTFNYRPSHSCFTSSEPSRSTRETINSDGIETPRTLVSKKASHQRSSNTVRSDQSHIHNDLSPTKAVEKEDTESEGDDDFRISALLIEIQMIQEKKRKRKETGSTPKTKKMKSDAQSINNSTHAEVINLVSD